MHSSVDVVCSGGFCATPNATHPRLCCITLRDDRLAGGHNRYRKPEPTRMQNMACRGWLWT